MKQIMIFYRKWQVITLWNLIGQRILYGTVA